MSGEPHSIAHEKIVELLVGLGLDPDMSTLAEVVISPHGITVTRHRRNESGHFYAVGDEIATEVVKIRIGNDAQWRGETVGKAAP